MFGTLIFVSQKGLLGDTLDFSRLDVTNPQILQIGNIQGRSTNSIMPFHHVDPKLLHCFS